MENQTQSQRLRASTVAMIGLIGLCIGFLLGCLTYKRFKPCLELPVVTVVGDTLIVRDTLRMEVPAAVPKGEVRRDTVWLDLRPATPSEPDSPATVPEGTSEGDTAPRLEPDGQLTIPISRKEYKTDDYRAVVEGWRPALISMEVYPKTTTITQTVTRLKKPRWGVAAGLGAGYAPTVGLYPSIGITVGPLLWSR